MVKPEFDLIDDYEHGDDEKTRCDFHKDDEQQHKMIEYHPVRINTSEHAKKNFRLLSHRFVMTRDRNSLIDTLCSCEFTLHAISNTNMYNHANGENSNYHTFG